MAPKREAQTRIWWNGDEVYFLAWTDHALLFRWNEAVWNGRGVIQLPRGATRRLLNKGVLVIEGEMPDWLTEKAPVGCPTRARPVPPPRPIPPPERPAPTPPKADLRSIVLRVIRRLTGEPPDPLRTG